MSKWALASVLVLTSAACNGRKQYTTEVDLLRVTPIRRDDTGRVLTTDVEMSFAKCPGDQRKTIRGDAAFSACVSKMKVGDKVPVTLDHGSEQDGIAHFRVLRVGDCERKIDPNDEASFEIVQVCTKLEVNSVVVGFHCERKPSAELLAACPWFRTR